MHGSWILSDQRLHLMTIHSLNTTPVLDPLPLYPQNPGPLEATDIQLYRQAIKHKYIHKLRKLEAYGSWTINYVH